MKFQPGHAGGPGRPKRSVEEAVLKAAVGAVPAARVAKILKAMADKAENGDVKAAALVLHFLFGNDPALTRQLGAELAAELEKVKERNARAGNNPPAVAGRVPPASPA
jgi:hypothetical protein